jgi:hypothetical protein
VASGPTVEVYFNEKLYYCLGSALARLEARVAFEEVVKR